MGMRWKKYDTGEKLNVGDLLWLEERKLSYVDLSFEDKDALQGGSGQAYIKSIPESWEFDLGVGYQDIRKRLTFDGEIYDDLGNFFDKIIAYVKYIDIAADWQQPFHLEQDYIEVSFYKDIGKLNFVENLLIPIFLDADQLKKCLLEKFGKEVFYNDIVVVGNYYNRLIKALRINSK